MPKEAMGVAEWRLWRCDLFMSYYDVRAVYHFCGERGPSRCLCAWLSSRKAWISSLRPTELMVEMREPSRKLRMHRARILLFLRSTSLMAAQPASDTVKIARLNIRLAYIFWRGLANC